MNWILLIAAIVISFLIFTWLVRVVKATIGTAIVIAIIVFGLQIFLGIGPADLVGQIQELWQGIWRSLSGES